MQACGTEIACSGERRNSALHTVPMRKTTLKKYPASVCSTALMACPRPAPKNITASRSAPATTLHFTHADRAIDSSDRMAIQIREEIRKLPTIQRFSHAQLALLKLDCTANKIPPGTHVISDSRIASTEDFPRMYSARENGRQK